MQQGLRMWRAEVAGLARKVEVAKDRLPTWPSDKLTVLAESPSAFYDLMPPQLIEQVLQFTDSCWKRLLSERARWLCIMVLHCWCQSPHGEICHSIMLPASDAAKLWQHRSKLLIMYKAMQPVISQPCMSQSCLQQGWCKTLL